MNLIDTAGIRETSDVVEQIGIQRSLKAISDAQLVIVVLDNSRALDEQDRELLKLTRDKTHIIVYNKTDVSKRSDGICIGSGKGRDRSANRRDS